MKTMKVNDIVTAALGIALVFLATWLLKVPNGIQGYFNLGDGFLLLFASVLNPFLAFMVGGVGSALACMPFSPCSLKGWRLFLFPGLSAGDDPHFAMLPIYWAVY